MSDSTQQNSPTLPEVSVEMTAEPSSINELFARDPLSWTDADLDRMIQHYRKARINWITDEKKEKAAKPAKVDVSGVTSGDDLLKTLGI